MDLSIVVVNWNSGPHLGALLRSAATLVPQTRELIVVDNHSRDDSLDGIDHEAESWKLVSLPLNMGFGGGANRGIERTNSEFILLVNPDVEVQLEPVRELYRMLQQEVDVGLVCPPLVDWEGRPQSDFQLRRFPSFFGSLSEVLGLDHVWGRLRRLWSRKDPRKIKTRLQGSEDLTGWQPAAAVWMLRRRVWEDLGGFDSAFYPAWFEDVDFCRRLLDRGWRIRFVQTAPIRHRGGHSLKALGYGRFVAIYYSNLLRYFRKHKPLYVPVLWFPVYFGIFMRQAWARMKVGQA